MQQQLYEWNLLLEDVQMSRIFEDGKTFVDCTPRLAVEDILQEYIIEKALPLFNLKEFVLARFELPQSFAASYKTDAQTTAEQHIRQLWPVLTRQPDEKKGTLIPLPHSYIVPGGRFGEVYYWDSYFTMLGLKASGMETMVENMINNFSHLIKTVGYIPNGNRTYFLGRSQPPFYSFMLQLLAEIKGRQILHDYLHALEAEYSFWMKGINEVKDDNRAAYHVVKMKDGEILNRYWDTQVTARPESYREDVVLSQESAQSPQELFRHLRAGAESGWDYSSRWFKDGKNFASIHTTCIIPVDLNCLLFHLEQTIAEAYLTNGGNALAQQYKLLAESRKQAVRKYCWNTKAGFYTDYDWEESQPINKLTLAGVLPLFCNLATSEQAAQMDTVLQQKFLKPGGLVTTLRETGQQWDAPNGWAPLQWMAAKGLTNYGHHSLAEEISSRWLALNDKVFTATGKMMEKYNVEDLSKEAGGGEYTSQDGFGWTNGVYLALKNIKEK